jgi:ATP-dependent DNA ligase
MTNFNVMLAHPVGKKEFDKDSFIQPKLDGVRCYITKHGAFSRNHKQFMNAQHILDELVPLFTKYPNVVLDGELYNHEYKDNFNKIISLVRKQTPSDAERNEAKAIQFHNYDIFMPDTPDNSFRYRNESIKNLHKEFTLQYCKTVETYHVQSDVTARLMYYQFTTKQGYEGAILRNNKPYEQKRSYNLQKYKEFHDTEATIIGWVEGQGKRTGTIGKFLARDANGIEFGMPVMDKMPVLTKMYDIAEWYIGKTATFTYFQRTPSGSYRHPLFKSIRNYE